MLTPQDQPGYDMVGEDVIFCMVAIALSCDIMMHLLHQTEAQSGARRYPRAISDWCSSQVHQGLATLLYFVLPFLTYNEMDTGRQWLIKAGDEPPYLMY